MVLNNCSAFELRQIRKHLGLNRQVMELVNSITNTRAAELLNRINSGPGLARLRNFPQGPNIEEE